MWWIRKSVWIKSIYVVLVLTIVVMWNLNLKARTENRGNESRIENNSR